MLVTTLEETLIAEIGHAFGYYDYGDEGGLVTLFSGPEATATYIRGYARGMLRGGFLHTADERCEGFIAYKRPGEHLGLKTVWPLLRGTLKAMRWSEMKEFVRISKQGGASLRDRFNKEKKPYLFVGLVCVREAYQGQGYMRKLMELAYAEGERLGMPVLLETDAKSKCDKYVHLGMELAGTRDLGAHGKLYDLVWYPKK